MDNKNTNSIRGGDQSPRRQSILKDTNINPMISDCLDNIFKVLNPAERKREWEKIKESLNLTEDEKRNI